MTRVIVFKTQVEFGDCDPAQIVWFPNFFRWVDAASRHFFVASGVPLWSELTRTRGIIGTPLLDTHASFKRTATYGDPIEVHTSVPDWGNKAFTMRHEIRSGEHLLAEISHFFEVYKDLEPGKYVKVGGWHTREEALKVVAAAKANYVNPSK